MKILVLNGPNLNLLGLREPEIYGHTTLEQIQNKLYDKAKESGVDLTFVQSNYEGVLVDEIQKSLLNSPIDFIIINPAALTHTSVALRDALLATKVPFIELHLSNTHAREKFRHHSYLSDVAIGVICGLGEFGYYSALDFAISYLHKRK